MDPTHVYLNLDVVNNSTTTCTTFGIQRDEEYAVFN
jgi:hypothetical protein